MTLVVLLSVSKEGYLMFLFKSIFPALNPKPEWLKCRKSLDEERGMFCLAFLDNKELFVQTYVFSCDLTAVLLVSKHYETVAIPKLIWTLYVKTLLFCFNKFASQLVTGVTTNALLPVRWPIILSGKTHDATPNQN